MTVSGSTIFRTFVIPGAMRKRIMKISRSRGLNVGRFSDFLCRMLSWWRSSERSFASIASNLASLQEGKLRLCLVGEFHLSIAPARCGPSLTKTKACAEAHGPKTLPKSAIVRQRDNARAIVKGRKLGESCIRAEAIWRIPAQSLLLGQVPRENADGELTLEQ